MVEVIGVYLEPHIESLATPFLRIRKQRCISSGTSPRVTRVTHLDEPQGHPLNEHDTQQSEFSKKKVTERFGNKKYLYVNERDMFMKQQEWQSSNSLARDVDIET